MPVFPYVYTDVDFENATRINDDHISALIGQEVGLAAAGYQGCQVSFKPNNVDLNTVTFYFDIALDSTEQDALTEIVNEYVYVSTIASTAIIEERYPIGTNAPNAAANTWSARAINTINSGVLFAEIDSVAKTITITQTGRFLFNISAPAYQVRAHQIRLINTDLMSGEIWMGTSEVTGASVMTRSTLVAEVTVNTAPQSYQIQHKCEKAAVSGFGVANGFEGDEVYTVCNISQA